MEGAMRLRYQAANVTRERVTSIGRWFRLPPRGDPHSPASGRRAVLPRRIYRHAFSDVRRHANRDEHGATTGRCFDRAAKLGHVARARRAYGKETRAAEPHAAGLTPAAARRG